jgi:hypothetical protein
MFNRELKKGSVILEVLIVIGLSALFFSAIAGLIMASNKSLEQIYNSQTAIWRAEQGIDAVRSIKFSNLSLISGGKISYSPVSDNWSLSEGSEIFDDGKERSITISEVQRDNSCLIVESGGTVDPDSYSIESNVSWIEQSGIEHVVTLNSLVVNWQNPQGSCFLPTDAGGISLDWSGGYWGGSKQLRGVYIINHTSRDITITKMTIWWDRPASKLQQLFAVGSKVWSSSGPGTPLGLQTSGTLIDTVDAIIPAGYTDETHKIQFTGAMEGSTIIISFEFADGSILVTDPFTP